MSATIFWRLWAVGVAALMAIFLLWPHPEPKKPPSLSASPPPPLPALPNVAIDAQDMQQLRESPLFGQTQTAAGSAAESPEDVGWSLVGTIIVDGQGVAVVRFEDNKKKPLELHTGDSLPNGKVIRAIDREGVLVDGEDSKSGRITVNAPPVPTLPQQ